MQTRRKSSDHIIEPPVTKKVKTTSEDGVKAVDPLKAFIKSLKTRKVLKARGITDLFPIQKQTFPIISEGHDLIGQDRTGSGKTLAYCLPLMEKLRAEGLFDKKPRVLIMVPTRELAIQVTTEIQSLRHEDDQFKVISIYGGTFIREQIMEVRRGVEWIVGTPGRLLDLLGRKALDFSGIRAVILDEADQMMQFGFQENVEEILQNVTQSTETHPQMILFSATIPAWLKQLTQKHMKPDRQYINLINFAETQAANQVQHYALPCAFGMSVGTVGDVVSVYGGRHSRTIIFCETKAQANDIMLKAKLPMEMQVLHGDIAQKQREVTFNAFKTGKFKCLVATNVASRGLDFPQVDLILQLEPPKEVDTYIHRAGRTARAGRTGVCITFYTKKQQGLIERIERSAKIKFTKINAPQPAEIIRASKRDLLVSLQQVSSDIVDLFKPVAADILKEIDVTEALSRALAYISGYKDRINQRSMLGSFEGFITYSINSTTPFRTPSYVWSFIRNNFDETLAQGIKGMRMTKDSMGVVFDLQEDLKEIFEAGMDQYLNQNPNSNFSYEVTKELPELQEENTRSFGNGRDNRESGSRSGGYGRDSRGGQGSFQRGGAVGGSQQKKYFASAATKEKQEIFIGGLSYNVTDADVKDLFSKQGVTFKDVRMLNDDTGNFKGIAFGIVDTEQQVPQALQLDGTSFQGRKLRINMANQKPR